jgi:uncharacterized integral membrane protein
VKYLKVLFWMVGFLFAIHFSMQNKAEVTLRYSFHDYQWELPQVPLFLIILCAIFFGVMIGGLGDLYKRFRLKRALRQSQKTVERLEKEIQALQERVSSPPSFPQKGE